jgi:hypothetical protein
MLSLQEYSMLDLKMKNLQAIVTIVMKKGRKERRERRKRETTRRSSCSKKRLNKVAPAPSLLR